MSKIIACAEGLNNRDADDMLGGGVFLNAGKEHALCGKNY